MNVKLLKFLFIQILICILFFIRISKNENNNSTYEDNKRIGIIAYPDDNNIGNQLLKYAMNVILKRYGFHPTLISFKCGNKPNNKFLKKHLNIKEISNYYTDLNESDYDYLIVNSDQVWAYNFIYILEIGFLSFAKFWNITKFIYAASTGYSYWTNSTNIINSAKLLIKQFSGISIREKNSLEMIKKYLGIEPIVVLDPTFLLDKNDYLEIIKEYKIVEERTENYLCSYILDKSEIIQNYIKNVSDLLNYNIKYIEVGVEDFIEKFIFSISICKLIITDSYHGTIFAIIFNKPFLTFINTNRGNIRFFSLNQTFHLGNRFINPTNFSKNDIDILTKNPDINISNFNLLKEQSIRFLKRNLKLIK